MYQQLRYILSLYLLIFFMFFSCDVVEKLTNREPVITEIYSLRSEISVNDTTTVIANAKDEDDDELTYSWHASGGGFNNNIGKRIVWTAPANPNKYVLTLTVNDGNGGEVSDSIAVTVLSLEKPIVEIQQPRNNSYLVGLGNETIEAYASHPNRIDRVEFFVNEERLGIDNRQLSSGVYTHNWNLDGLSGQVKITAVAYRTGPDSVSGEHSVIVHVEGVSPVP